tara:strand:- start:62 stop:514 length:453 start_codon:yes stop_codon:yes gene_type:complete
MYFFIFYTITYVLFNKDYFRPLNWNFKLVLISVLFSALPILNFFNLYDHYLSFSLYSGKIPQLFIQIKDNEADHLEKVFSDNYSSYLTDNQLLSSYFTTKKNDSFLSFYKLCIDELHVPPVIEKDVILGLSEYYTEKNINYNFAFYPSQD